MRFSQTTTLVLLYCVNALCGSAPSIAADSDDTQAGIMFFAKGECRQGEPRVQSVELVLNDKSPLLPSDWVATLERIELTATESDDLSRWIEQPECTFPKLRTVVLTAQRIDSHSRYGAAITSFMRRHPDVHRLILHGDCYYFDDTSSTSSFVQKIDGTALSNLEHLSLQRCRVRGTLPSLLSSIKLKELEIDFGDNRKSWPPKSWAIDDLDLSAIAQQADLQSLKIAGCVAKSSQLDFVQNGNRSLAICLGCCEIDSMNPFRHCPSLEFKFCCFQHAALPAIADFDRLKSFRSILCGCEDFDNVVDVIRFPSSLQHFQLRTSELSSGFDEQIVAAASRIQECAIDVGLRRLNPDQVSKLARVQQLIIFCPSPSKECLEQLHTLSKLESLHVCFHDTSPAYLRTIISLPHVRKLSLAYFGEINNFTAPDALIKNNRITDITLSGLPPTTSNFVVSQCPQVSRLSIASGEIGDSEITRLKELSDLKVLAMSFIDCPDKILEQIIAMPIKRLELNDDRLQSQHFEWLSTNGHIENLQVVDSAVRLHSVKRMKANAFKIGTTGSLHLHGPLSDDGDSE